MESCSFESYRVSYRVVLTIEFLRKMVKIRDGPGVRDPRGSQKSIISGPEIKTKSEKFLKYFSVDFGLS